MSIIAGYMVPHPPIILPEVGRGEEKKIQRTIDSYRNVAADIAALEPETIVITTPHSVMYSDYNHISPGARATGSMAAFNAPQVKIDVDYDQEMVHGICTLAEQRGLRAGTLGQKDKTLDHATMIPLYFIEKAYEESAREKNYQVIRVGLSGQPLIEQYALGLVISQAAESLGRRTVFVASGDLSHCCKADGPYGFHEEGPVYDSKIMKTMGRGSFGELFDYPEALLEGAEECGHRSFVIMAGAFDGVAVSATQYSHEDVFGVGYGICSFKPLGPDSSRCFGQEYVKRHDAYLAERKAKEDLYVSLARRALETYVRDGERIKLEDVGEAAAASENVGEGSAQSNSVAALSNTRAGTFVSLHINGVLRGCIGTTGPTKASVGEEIIANAISAATRDPRFEPVTEAELPELEYSVDVLGETEPILSRDELDVKKYGVIVTRGSRSGLLLPNLDGIRDVDQQIAIAKQKAGIGENEEVGLERFQVIRHY
ncbi:AmmeMemoRadiSam system protein A [Aminicella lysinilytica]|uniref:AmmeMemoRadiSam system protein A n=1 Tax=Aminicella lysinilytica TaxID=433323 RepID=UPI0026EFF5C7|nr:AmmeMemoRadiSam system protein A [Aminicella lysinilytica]